MSDEANPHLEDASLLGDLDPVALEVALRPLFERAGPLVEILLGRHFASWEDVLSAAGIGLASADEDVRGAALRAHPPLGEDPDRLRKASVVSWEEQGRGSLTPEATAEELVGLNRTYEARFGFPFVEWVNGRPLTEIIPVIRSRLANDRGTELDNGCRALLDIAKDRLERIRTEAAGS